MIFRGSGGPKMRPKWIPKYHPAATWLQERLGSLPGSIFKHLGAHFGARARGAQGPLGARGETTEGGYLGSESQISEHQYLSDLEA